MLQVSVFSSECSLVHHSLQFLQRWQGNNLTVGKKLGLFRQVGTEITGQCHLTQLENKVKQACVMAKKHKIKAFCLKKLNNIIIYRDFPPPLRSGCQVKSDNTHIIINAHHLANILDICALIFSSCARFTVYPNRIM